ncbi:hypothetical protein PENSPDRAFT_749899 [Peniophora sp. CONT]|nr:hypothetical protein PENSPDRAFT_749899 [Peniophora sp. CONT]
MPASGSCPDGLPLPPDPTDLRVASDAPDYSPEPSSGEMCLSLSPTLHNESAIRRTFFARQDDITLAFVRQRENIPVPRYGRAGCVSGEVRLASNFGVTSVSLQLEGRLVIDLKDRPPTTFTYHFLKIPLPLWEKGTAGGEKAPPFAMPFSIDFPEAFTDDHGKELPLPPSYETQSESSNLKDLCVQCSYTMCVRLARSRFLPSKMMVQKLTYEPRTVPPPHTLAFPFPYHSITDEITPLGWSRYDEVVVARPSKGFRNIHCQLYAPALRVYSIKSGPIPYFLRIRGHHDDMVALLGDAAPTSAPHPTLRSRTCAINVQVERQVSVEAGRVSTSRSYIIGKGTLRDVPPAYQHGQEECTVDYEGEIQIDPTVSVGGFDIVKLSIADFFIFSVKAPDPHNNAFDELTHSHAIRIVTGL